jgi:hypothetical protein
MVVNAYYGVVLKKCVMVLKGCFITNCELI